MKCQSINIIGSGLEDDPAVNSIYTNLYNTYCQNNGPLLPDYVVGDIIGSLAAPHLPGQGTDGYCLMMDQIFHGRRWMHLVRRLDYTRHHREDLLERQAELYCDRLWHIAAHHLPNSSVVVTGEQLAQWYQERMSETPPAPEEDSTAEPLNPRDYSTGLVDDFSFVILQLGFRCENLQAQRGWMDEELIKACLGVEWDPCHYQPRQLRVITLPGEKDQALPGDQLTVRGITKKTREDQIPSILPSELGLWMRGDQKSRQVTMDKIVNRAPAIYEHFDTRRPQIRHRIFLLMLVDVERDFFQQSAPSATDDSWERAERAGKSLAYDWLLNAAQHVPSNQIEVEVAWMEQREQEKTLLGFEFPLKELKPLSGYDAGWRNLLQVDRALPHFFVRHMGGTRTDYRARFKPVRGQPKDRLDRALASGSYELCLVAAVTAHGGELRIFPDLSMSRPDSHLNTVLLVSVEPLPDQAKELAGFRGAVFPDLAGARLGNTRLKMAPVPDLLHLLMDMLIGPATRRPVTDLLMSE